MSKRRTFTPQQKSQIVLELLKENKTVAEIAAEYEIHPNQLLRWKSEAMEKMHLLFTKDSDEVEKVKKKHDAEVEEIMSSKVRKFIRNSPVNYATRFLCSRISWIILFCI